MWTLINQTPYKVGKTWGRNKEGVHEWIVAVKATFDISANGSLKLADEQLEPLYSPEYNGEGQLSSVRYDADLVSPKPTTDLILNGTAYAPRGRPSTDFLIGMKVGSIQKILRVKGDRHWEDGLFGVASTSAQPVSQVPIVYERAYGGYDHSNADCKKHHIDLRNPVGCGVANADNRVGQAVPNFEYPDGDIQKNSPAGFGVIDSFWSPRCEFAGTYDEKWKKNRLPLLPEDWDPRSLLCSPVDQRPSKHFNGGERVELSNVTPNGKLILELPKKYLTFRTRIDNRVEEHRSRLSTVVIEPDYPRVLMTWTTSLICRGNIEYLDETIVREKPFI